MEVEVAVGKISARQQIVMQLAAEAAKQKTRLKQEQWMVLASQRALSALADLRGLAARLRKALRKQQATHKMLAAVIGVSTDSVSAWTQGRRVPDAATLACIAAALDVQLRWLLGEKEEEEKCQKE